MDKSGECYQCRHFDRYYTKETRHFQPTKCGFCYKNQSVVNLHEDCENYQAKRWHRRDETFLRFCLNDLLTEISELRSILEAGRNEE